jgi:hypothetical protein
MHCPVESPGAAQQQPAPQEPLSEHGRHEPPPAAHDVALEHCPLDCPDATQQHSLPHADVVAQPAPSSCFWKQNPPAQNWLGQTQSESSPQGFTPGHSHPTPFPVLGSQSAGSRQIACGGAPQSPMNPPISPQQQSDWQSVCARHAR